MAQLTGGKATTPDAYGGIRARLTRGVVPGGAFSPAITASLAILMVSALVSVGYVAAVGGLSVRLGAGRIAALAEEGSVQADPARTSPSPRPAVAPDTSIRRDVPRPNPVRARTAVMPPRPHRPMSSVAGHAPATPKQRPAPVHPASGPPTPPPAPHRISDRFAVLRRCDDGLGCYVYAVRSGDNLFSIARWFGIPLDSIYAMNPWVASVGLRPGATLRIPTPTR